MNTNTSTPAPLYPRITEWDAYTYCRPCGGERMALCPDCGYTLCVFCQDECEECGGSLF